MFKKELRVERLTITVERLPINEDENEDEDENHHPEGNPQLSRLLFPSASELRFVLASACKLAYNAQRAQPKLNNEVVNPQLISRTEP